ncbi:tetratricopeptide repeat protein [Roseovarius sp. MMSF_3281]|uniref:tetratricopeptide repeat protein n=1 Tax=Roseovarius sp. MMSF_3281 TaxID=3046694 RepID=UPI00274007D3|nr:tetratricopeptide repeat protein [Roseovarius sp. MMSF_3281]
MEWLYEFGVVIWDWFGDEDHQNRVTSIAAALTVILTIAGAVFGAAWYMITRLVLRRNAPKQVPDQSQPAALPQGDVLSMDQHLTILQKREEQLEAKLSTAHAEEKDLLQRQIAELQTQIANPEESLAKAQKRINDLEALLDREANQIGADRIAEAKAALDMGDYSLADDIFAEIEAQNELAVQETARAAFGRGEVAEAEVRWGDAYTHYKRANDLHETFVHLSAYARMTWRLAKGAEAILLHEKLVEWAKLDHGDKSAEYATQLNNFAQVVQAQGQFERSETLLREALEIDRTTIGAKHRDYAMRHNNLAGVVQAQGRYEEAEKLFREALEIDRATIGEVHPDYAWHLNNLAMVVKAQERYAEAEGLYREALEIDRATIGKVHPDYARHLNNLALMLNAQGRCEEAAELFREVLEIDRMAIGERHPDYAIDLHNCAGVLVTQGKPEEARPLFEKALGILRATLPPDHPHIGVVEKQIAKLP